MQSKEIYVKGMQCVSCEQLICNGLKEIEGVDATADFVKGKVSVNFDETKVSLKTIENAIEKQGFKVIEESRKKEGNIKGKEVKKSGTIDTLLQYIVIILGLNYILNFLLGINLLSLVFGTINNLVSQVPVVDENTSMALLFVIGILTSFHCVAMCGGINVTQCLAFKGESKSSPNLMYNLGRVVSYTVLGGIVGAIGSVFTVTPKLQASLYVVVGCFMVLMGLNLYGVNIARKFLPKMPKAFRNLNKNGNAPFVVGLMNGLMPCGPLQSMQIYALSTGSFVEGALSMFFFSVGTVPLMYIFGKIGEFKNPKIAKNFMKVSAVLVLFLGVIMANRGLALLGIGVPSSSGSTAGITAEVTGDEQVVYTELEPRGYPDIVVKKGVPVKWVLNVSPENLNGCNNEIIIGEYGIQQKLVAGENIIEFTPTETGNFRYSCWMGMIRATITVVD